jgi:hypothetical protein
MKFKRIFGRNYDVRLCTVLNPGERIKGRRTDSFSKLLHIWNDTQHLLQLIVENESSLTAPGYNRLSVDELIDQILQETDLFEAQIRRIANGESGYENLLLSEFFTPLFKKVYVLQLDGLFPENENPVLPKSRLRIYAVKLKGFFIVTAGAIRFSDLPETELDEEVKWKLNEVCHYFKKKPVFDPWGLEENKS